MFRYSGRPGLYAIICRMTTSFAPTYFRKNIALPSEHGSWVFILSPLLIGMFAGGRWTAGSISLIVASLAAFMIRQPVTIAVKAYTKRRPQRDLPAAWLWISIYGLVGLAAIASLAAQGFAYLLILALPGLPVFIWHLYLVSKRLERRQAGVEVVASGVLALAAPAAYWVAVGRPDPMGWWLFALTWVQSAASIVYAYLRLEQRELLSLPEVNARLRMGRRALIYTTFNLSWVILLSIFQVLPGLLPIPYLLQWAETLWGTLRPAIGVKPTAIGIRQLVVSTLYTLLFIVAWKIG
jgi:YwiC-like protein